MSKLLRRLTYLMLLGIMTYILTMACSLSSSDYPRSLVQPANDCRIIQHTMGKTCVPNNPQRLITLSQFTLANVLVLGVKPIGSTSDAWQVDFPSYLNDKTEGIKNLGTEQRPNLERILQLKPDLILGKINSEAIYPLLSQIAPTALGNWESTPSWRDHFNFVAKVLNKEEAAQQIWNHYHQRIQELKNVLGNRYKNQKISVITVLSNGSIFADAKNSFLGSILNDVGLQRPKSQDIVATYGAVPGTFSQENLDAIDGDILFILTFTDDDRNKLKKLQQKPLWKKLRAVQKGQVYFWTLDKIVSLRTIFVN